MMNILYLHTHDSGRYVQPYGYAVPTPNLMALAQRGVIFRHCYAAAPTCSPSRAAMLTGQNAHASGMLGLAHRGFALRDPSQHLAHHLQRHGCETVLCGVQHVTVDSRVAELGYERVLQGDERHARDDVPANIRRDLPNAHAVADYLKTSKDRPFFLSYGMIATHRVFPEAADDIDPNVVQPPAPLPDTALTRRDMAKFMTSARYADDCLGIILEALRESGLEDDTCVVFTTDHGIAFPGMKCHLYDSGIGVALIMAFPGTQHQGTCLDALVSHLDVYPTLCDAAGVEKPAWLEGASMMPLLTGDAERIREEIFAEVTYHAAYEPMRCIRTERYKYIRYYDDFEFMVKPNIDDGHSKQFLLRHGLEERPHDEAEMLFDLYYDPAERRNLAHDPAHADIRRDLAARLRDWMEATQDPLLHGYVPKPDGARVNIKHGLHPNEWEFED